MKRMLRVSMVAALAATPATALAQSFDTVGTRAAGMGGAFVAVSDDASAAYWNPAGFASGSYFSLVLDRTTASTTPRELPTAGSRSGFLLALGAPPLALSYYRLRSASVEPTAMPAASRNIAGTAEVRVSTLVTHHAGVTLVQTIVPGVSVGATVKLVHGIAASAVEVDGDRTALLADVTDSIGRSTNKFDLDLGLMATRGRVKAGLAIRNLTEPGFETTGATPLRLERQARAGVAISPVEGWTLAADLDLLKTAGAHGEARDVALGAEGRVGRRAVVRAGTRWNTAAQSDGGRAPSVAAGGSYAVTAGIFLDTHVTAGSDRAARGWGVAARFVY